MELKVEKVSVERIKPFSPTPPEKGSYEHSLLDQLTPQVDVNCVLFYPPNAINNKQIIHNKLKLSLSKALADFYPLAGRSSDSLSIICNDLGVSYTEAQVLTTTSTDNVDMSTQVMIMDDHSLLELMIPDEPLANLVDKNRPLLSVQATTFTSCGGLAIGVKVSHSIADASALASFLAHWAGISRGGAAAASFDGEEGDIVVDCASLFPPRNLPVVQFSDLISPEKARACRVVKRFVFDGCRIASLRERLGIITTTTTSQLQQRPPTRYEALAALIWAAAIRVSQDSFDQYQTSNKSHIALTVINLRKRVDPPLPGRSLGSTIQCVAAGWPTNKAVDLTELAGKLSESIKPLNDPNYVRDLHLGEEYLKTLQGYFGNIKDLNLSIAFSSWCRFPFYETDFGWGKPDMVATSFPLYTTNAAIFVDAKDGEGVQVWIGLSKEDMAKFEQDRGILQYAS